MQADSLPAPYTTRSVINFSHVIGWKDEIPEAPKGFVVEKYADGFENPRWLYITANGDVLVAESNSNYTFLKKVGGFLLGASKSNSLSHSADRITLLRDTNKDGMPDQRETLLTGLNQPFGMLVIDKWLYVGNTNSLIRYLYKTGQTKITDLPEKIVDLPAGKHNRHWARNIITNSDSSKIYISVGSGSNVAEKGIANELLRATILEINPDGSDLRIYASGLRNPVGMGWAPGTTTLWTVVNERDELGDELVPDYFTSVSQEGFYGWPYSYNGQNFDPRVKELKTALVKKAIVPDVNVGNHTATLGLAFYTGNLFPEKYKGGAFLTQHGSWNRSVLAGYKVIFIPFKNGKPSGQAEDFLTGFLGFHCTSMAQSHDAQNNQINSKSTKNQSTMNSTNTFEFKALPYAHDALEPFIDKLTVEIHYGKHHKAYFDNFITAIKGTEMEAMDIKDIFKNISKYPVAVRNNGGGYFNHTFYWEGMKASGGGLPTGKLSDAITKSFTSFDEFKKQFSDAGKTRFGSGWAWLGVDDKGKLFISSTPNQDNPLMDLAEKKGTPLLVMDVWEHAYYLKYQNKRPDYIEAFWNVANWTEVAKRYEKALNGL